MTDIVKRLRSFDVFNAPMDIDGIMVSPVALMAADEIERLLGERDRLRSCWLLSIQTENSCAATGQPCRARCGCALEQEALTGARAALKEMGHEADE
jgi:hypothetical protein